MASRKQRDGFDLVSLPKAELHLHLEGSMRFETLVSLCKKHNIQVPPDTRGQQFEDFSKFADVYVAACECLRDESDIYRLVLEVAQDAAKSGATWIEPALSIMLYAERFDGIEAALRVLAEAAEKAESETNVGIGFILAVERHFPVSQAEMMANIVHKVTITDEESRRIQIFGRPAIVGFGLHGPEEGYPPEPFANAFKIACEGTGVISVPHAGEFAPFPGDGAKSVRGAISTLKAKRIAHGVLSVNDNAVLQEIVEKNICLDICVSSNQLLGVVDSIGSHPLRNLIDSGVPCTINSDDSLLFGCNLLCEYAICRDALGLSDEMLASLAQTSFQHSCAPRAVIEDGCNGIKRWLNNRSG
uniref:Adenosine deaminase domain-containing protein n=1 Tax=Ditylum brightwellii TaxID=49249 RepID=A0A7S2EI49_9STRA|mmetsp:Transcript_30377/g.45169  ORF Transcript_30377/g.45169 Transcript_30377/m.45169 type:complete len:359 (+) Transcript_30377:134-1210(+)